MAIERATVKRLHHKASVHMPPLCGPTPELGGQNRNAVLSPLNELLGISFDAMAPTREEPTIDRDVDNDHHTGKRELDFSGEA